eukprot:5839830-Amphidinium_carterae.1
MPEGQPRTWEVWNCCNMDWGSCRELGCSVWNAGTSTLIQDTLLRDAARGQCDSIVCGKQQHSQTATLYKGNGLGHLDHGNIGSKCFFELALLLQTHLHFSTLQRGIFDNPSTLPKQLPLVSAGSADISPESSHASRQTSQGIDLTTLLVHHWRGLCGYGPSLPEAGMCRSGVRRLGCSSSSPQTRLIIQRNLRGMLRLVAKPSRIRQM